MSVVPPPHPFHPTAVFFHLEVSVCVCVCDSIVCVCLCVLVCVCVCVCVRMPVNGGQECQTGTPAASGQDCCKATQCSTHIRSVCVCVCVCVRESEQDTTKQKTQCEHTPELTV